MPMKEQRLTLRVEDDDAARAFYRDTLGVPVLEGWNQPAAPVAPDGMQLTLFTVLDG